MPKTSFARPEAASATKSTPPMPPGARKAGTPPAPAAKSSVPLPPGRKPAAVAPATPPASDPVEVKTSVVETPQAAAPPAPRPRGRPPGAPNKPAPAAPKVTETALATVPVEETGRIVVFTGKAGRIEGDMEITDFTLPQFKVASGAGPLKLLDDPIVDGALVIGAVDQWFYLFNGEGWEPVGVTIIKARKGFAQKKNENGDSLYEIEEQGLLVDTIDELKAVNGTLQDVLGMKVFEAVLNAHVLIRLPDGLEDSIGLFDKEIEGVLYAQAMWRIRGSAYRDCAKHIYDESKQGGFIDQTNGNSYDGEFLATSKYIKGSKNAWYIPTLENGEAHTEAFKEVAATL